METVVVVASRMEQSISDVAGSVAVVSSEDIEKQMANNIEESLRYIPGVSMNGNSRFKISLISMSEEWTEAGLKF